MRTARVARGVASALAVMAVIQFLALWLVVPFERAGYRAVDDPANPAYGALLFGVILVASVAMLIAIRYDFQTLIRGGIIAVAGILSWYVFAAVAPTGIRVGLGGVEVAPIPLLGAGLIVAALLRRPEWYVIDLSAVVIGAGATALFGISFTVLPIVVLLLVLAVYDAISVYGTKHMLTLAEGAMSMHLPVLLVIPLSADFSTAEMDDGGGIGDDADGDPAEGELDAIFLGLGDVVIPSILIVSAAAAGLGSPVVNLGPLGLGWPVLGGVVGSLAGLAVLIVLVLRGTPHAGLPLLNGGVILGYLAGALAAGLGPLAALGL